MEERELQPMGNEECTPSIGELVDRDGRDVGFPPTERFLGSDDDAKSDGGGSTLLSIDLNASVNGGDNSAPSASDAATGSRNMGNIDQRQQDMASVFYDGYEDGYIVTRHRKWKKKSALVTFFSLVLVMSVLFTSRLVSKAADSFGEDPESFWPPDRAIMDKQLLNAKMAPRGPLVFSDGGGLDCVCGSSWDGVAQVSKLMDGESNGIFTMLGAFHAYMLTHSWGVVMMLHLLRMVSMETWLVLTGAWGLFGDPAVDAPPRYSVVLRDTVYAKMGLLLAVHLSKIIKSKPVAEWPIASEASVLGGMQHGSAALMHNRHSPVRALWCVLQILLGTVVLGSADSTFGQNRLNPVNLMVLGIYSVIVLVIYFGNCDFWPELSTVHVRSWHVLWVVLVWVSGSFALSPIWRGMLNVGCAFSVCVALLCVVHVVMGLDMFCIATKIHGASDAMDANGYISHPGNGDIVHLDCLLAAHKQLCYRYGHLVPYARKPDIHAELERQRSIRVSKHTLRTSRMGYGDSPARYGRTYRTDMRRTACKYGIAVGVFIIAIATPLVMRTATDQVYDEGRGFMYSAGWCGNPVTYTSFADVSDNSTTTTTPKITNACHGM